MPYHRSSIAATCIALATTTLITHLPNQAQAQATPTPTQCTGLNPPISSSSLPPSSAIIASLNLTTNVEGGYYIETFRDAALFPDGNNNRSISTAIYYLLEGPGPPSVWHRVDAAEVWHYYAGAPLVLELAADDGEPVRRAVLGPDVLGGGQRPQQVVAAWEWQRAVSCGEWTLVGTTVAPAFVPEGYELAPDGWEPNGA